MLQWSYLLRRCGFLWLHAMKIAGFYRINVITARSHKCSRILKASDFNERKYSILMHLLQSAATATVPLQHILCIKSTNDSLVSELILFWIGFRGYPNILNFWFDCLNNSQNKVSNSGYVSRLLGVSTDRTFQRIFQTAEATKSLKSPKNRL